MPDTFTCSGCGAARARLPLHVRTFHCDACGPVIDRDENAARNVAALAAARITGTEVAGDTGTDRPGGRARTAERR
ncbi:zinc ribbon domain-containing protein [Kitasatospora sp. NPDC001159]